MSFFDTWGKGLPALLVSLHLTQNEWQVGAKLVTPCCSQSHTSDSYLPMSSDSEMQDYKLLTEY